MMLEVSSTTVATPSLSSESPPSISLDSDDRDAWLSSQLATQAVQGGGPAASECWQVSMALGYAHRVRLSDPFVRAADLLLCHRACTLQGARFELPPAIWMEYSPAARPSSASLLNPVVAGTLFMRSPSDPDALTVVVGWRDEHGAVGLCPAIGQWSLAALRAFRCTDGDDGQAALLSLGSFGVPPGMTEEMEFRAMTQGRAAFSKEVALSNWKVAQEAIFSLSALCLMDAGCTVLTALGDLREASAGEDSNEVSLEHESPALALLARWRNPKGGLWRPSAWHERPVWTEPSPA